jgi:enamine deaminase RidA (YjgF/YER057c/UK114 family)
MQTLLPPGWPRPKGYANGIAAEGRMVFVAGEVGWNPVSETFETSDFSAQVRQALRNVVAVLAEAGARPEHIVRMTWFVTDKREYLASLDAVGRAWREVIGKHFPCMAAIEVKGLMESEAKIEIETTAVIPSHAR